LADYPANIIIKIFNHSIYTSRLLLGNWPAFTSNIFLLKERFKSTKYFSLNFSSPIFVRTILLVASTAFLDVKKSAN